MSTFYKRLLFTVLAVFLVSTGVGMTAEKLTFVDWSWDSARVHNRIAGFIAEHGFGYETDYVFADTIPGIQGMRRGDLDVSMETWVDNFQDLWDEALAQGELIDLGPNFPNAPQGWYVPTYLIEGDSERGIEPLTPDLKSVEDLPEYWEVFKDRENPRKGRFFNGVTGWFASKINLKKLKAYGLDDYYDVFYPGSQAALDASIVRAYERGEPWFGYYWEPTWIMGTLDMTMLEEPENTEMCWDEGEELFECAFPAVAVRVSVNKNVATRAPEFVEFLKKYETTLQHTNEALAYMEENNAEDIDAARWFLQEYEHLWTPWLAPDVATKVKAAL